MHAQNDTWGKHFVEKQYHIEVSVYVNMKFCYQNCVSDICIYSQICFITLSSLLNHRIIK